MHSDSSNQRLGDYVDLQRGNTYQSALLGKPGPVLLGLASIDRNGGFRDNNLKTYGGTSDPRMLLHPGDIYVSLKDVTQSADLLGSVARVPKYIKLGRITQDTVKLIFKDKDAPANYIYWILRAPQYREYCRAHATGTTNLGLPREDFLSFPIPELTAGRAELAILLQALDDKIELNRRMNETLEAMAQAIFRDWFVDFGPTRRQLAGATESVQIMGGLTPDPEKAATLAPLFPPTLAANGLPEGWEERTVGNISVITGGATPSTKAPEYWEGGDHLWATPKDLSKLDGLFVSTTERQITDAGLAQIGSGLAPVGSVLLSSRAPIGYLAIADRPVAVNQGFIVLRPTRDFPTAYALFWCRENMELIKANANGSTFQEISKRNFRPIPVIFPGSEALTCFTEAVGPLLDLTRLHEKQNTTLATVRDLLLPKLMSGEIRLRDAERVGDEAAA